MEKRGKLRKAEMTKTICLDFDGVCNTYDGWKGEDYLFEPQFGLLTFLYELISAGYSIAIFSTRPADKLKKWFDKYGSSFILAQIEKNLIFFPDKKPPALVYIDDRAILFRGSFNEILPQILTFKAHWEK